MCLIGKRTSFAPGEFENQKFYKVYRVKYRGENKGWLQAPIQDTIITRPGEIVSDREHKELGTGSDNAKRERNCWAVFQGIHVFFNKEDAFMFSIQGRGELVFEVECKEEDLVAISDCGQEAVFMKVTLPESEWNRAFAGEV